MQRKIWLITGASSGLGKALVTQLLNGDDIVLATFRNPEQAAEFSQRHPQRTRGFCLDVTNRRAVEEAWKEIEWEFGGVDVLVNNAGFAFTGAVEESSETEIRQVMEAHFHAPLHLTQCVLPGMRKKKSGHIVQISSHGGIRALPGFGIYNASKFALEGFSEALWGEVKPLGIHVILVEPGPFRTQFAGKGLQEAKNLLSDYTNTAGIFRQRLKSVDGMQEGDPQKAAQAILQAVSLADPPLRLPLGKIALVSLQFKLEWVQKDLEFWRKTAEKAVFEPSAAP